MVCAIAGKPRFRFSYLTREVTDLATGVSYTPKVSFGQSYVYILPGQQEWKVTIAQGTWCFNGATPREEWPTSHRRLFRCGDAIFDVKPEDDSLSFEASGTEADLQQALMGFYLRFGTGPGD